MKAQIIHRIYDNMGTKFMTNWKFKSKKLAKEALKGDYNFITMQNKYTDIKFNGERLEYKEGKEINELYIDDLRGVL